MTERSTRSLWSMLLGAGVVSIGVLASSLAVAQVTPAPQPGVVPVAAPPVAPAPDAVAPPPPPPPPVVEVVAPPPPPPMLPPPPPPAADDGTAKPLEVHAWGRIGTVIQGGTDPSKLNDISQGAEVDLLFAGKVSPLLGWQANLYGMYGGGSIDGADVSVNPATMAARTSIGILDLHGKLEFHDAFNVWIGRMLVPSDRSNFSGPWFMAPWNYPGLSGPKQGPVGRNDGATVFGWFAGGMAKYYVGVFDLHNVSGRPLFTGRFNLALREKEPGFYHSSTYYGKEVLSIAVGGQFQKDAETTAAGVADYSMFNADALFEQPLGGGNVVDVEAAFFHFDSNNSYKNSFFGLASFLVGAEVGPGKLQPLFRFQGASPQGGGDMDRVIDAQVGYVIKDYAGRMALGYQNAKVAGVSANQIFFGLQLQK